MKTRLFIATTLALGTAALSTGCDKASNVMSKVAAKASELEGKLMHMIGPGGQPAQTRSNVPQRGGETDTGGGWEMPADNGGGWDMPQRGDEGRGWEMPADNGGGWEMPSADNGGGWDMPQRGDEGGGWELPADNGGGWEMPADNGGAWEMPADNGGAWEMPADNGGGWNMPAVEDPAAFQRRMATQQRDFNTRNQQIQADSDRRFNAVQDWTKTVIRGE